MTAIIARRSFSNLVLMPLVLSFALGLFGTAGPAYAGVPIYIGLEGIAIEGYDPVAYFTEGRPMKGTEQYTYKWLGATWHFANAKHRDLFAADPVKYAPQYGGFCSRATYSGTLSAGDPTAWRIIDGKLYLFRSQGTLARFENDSVGQGGQIDKANANWPKLKAQYKLQPR